MYDINCNFIEILDRLYGIANMPGSERASLNGTYLQMEAPNGSGNNLFTSNTYLLGNSQYEFVVQYSWKITTRWHHQSVIRIMTGPQISDHISDMDTINHSRVP